MSVQTAQPRINTGLHAALASGTRPRRPSALTASLALGRRALLKIKHVPEQLFDVTAFPVMMTVSFTYLFGGALAGSPVAYLHFVLPGILVQAVLMITMYTGMGLNTDVAKGIFDRFRSLPIWRPAVVVGALLGDVARYTLASAVIILLGLVMGFRPDAGLAGVIPAVALLLLFSFSLAWVWIMIGLIVQTQTSVLSISMLILFPLTFASNVFVDPATMPGWLRAFVGVNPVTLLVTAVRGLMHGTATAGQLTWVFVACVVLVAVFAPVTMFLYGRKNAG